METVKKGDFVEIEFTGYANGDVFDSNIKENLAKINPKANSRKTIVVVGEKMVVKGFDEALEGKEIGKEYGIELKREDAFGERNRDLVRTIPLKSFTEQKVNPQPGMVLNLDGGIVRIITVSGARVVTDFNNPLSGKDIKYEFKIIKKVDDEKEKTRSIFENLIGFVPEFDVKDKIIMKGAKGMEIIVEKLKDKFKDLLGKELVFEEKKPEKKEDQEQQEKPQ